MSTTANSRFASRGTPHERAIPRRLFGPFVFGTVALALTLLAAGVATDPERLIGAAPELIVWAAVAALVGLAAVTFVSGSELGLDAPLLIAAAIWFGPVGAGLIAFVGYVDRREFRREVSLERALFNRSQIALSVMAAGVGFDAVGGDPSRVSELFLATPVAVAVDMTINWAMVLAVRVLHEGVSAREAVAGAHTGRVPEFVLGYVAFSLLSSVIAQSYAVSRLWALAMFTLMAMLGRHAFETSQSLTLAHRELREKETELRIATERVADERRDERLAVAAGLHDEVLPPLFKVHLMGQVVRQDLAGGRLLALEDDVPELIRATEVASESMRRLIGDLRSSPIGAHGLKGTLELLCQQVGNDADIRVYVDLAEVAAPPMVQLLAYQVGREALLNAVRHSEAGRIDVSLRAVDGSLRLVVGDDGKGFIPSRVDPRSHFGLQLIRDRVELFGGTMVVDSTPGAGTRVVVRIPTDPGKD